MPHIFSLSLRNTKLGKKSYKTLIYCTFYIQIFEHNLSVSGIREIGRICMINYWQVHQLERVELSFKNCTGDFHPRPTDVKCELNDPTLSWWPSGLNKSNKRWVLQINQLYGVLFLIKSELLSYQAHTLGWRCCI